MRNSKRAKRQRILRAKPAARPTAFTLLMYIVASAFTGGMLLVLVSGGSLVAFLYYNHFPLDNLLALLAGTIIVMSFYRGCAAWQQDLNEYHSRMSGIQHAREFKNLNGS